MLLIAQAVAALVALLHVWFMVLEMFLWKRPIGRKTFATTAEFAEQSATLAANQGLYNGFLVAGIVWGLLAPAPLHVPVLTFFLACVVVAGLYGGITVSRRILFVQMAPALVAVVLLRL